MLNSEMIIIRMNDAAERHKVVLHASVSNLRFKVSYPFFFEFLF